MKIVVDENIPLMTVSALRGMGHGVLDFRGTAEEGGADSWVWERSQQEQALLNSTDKGFGRRQSRPHFGVVVVRLRQPSRARIHQRVMQSLAQFSEEEWPGLTVVMKDHVQTVYRVGV